MTHGVLLFDHLAKTILSFIQCGAQGRTVDPGSCRRGLSCLGQAGGNFVAAPLAFPLPILARVLEGRFHRRDLAFKSIEDLGHTATKRLDGLAEVLDGLWVAFDSAHVRRPILAIRLAPTEERSALGCRFLGIMCPGRLALSRSGEAGAPRIRPSS